jgi:hypothetical protein
MNGPIRLLDSSPNPAARTLLQAGLRERPRPSALRSTTLALGVGGSVVAASTSAAASAGVAAIVTPLVAPSLMLLVTKWVAVGMLGGLALASDASLISDPAARQHAATMAPRAAASAGSERVRVTPASPSPTPEAPGVELEAQGMAPPAAAVVGKPAIGPKGRLEMAALPPAAPTSASLPNAKSLSREIAMIDASRRALSSGSATAALAQLDEYAASLRTGTLDREAQLLRIDALTGQRAAALALAERYLASYPNDPHAARLRELGRAP